ncbi:MAG TPA: prolyl oligopeptidase family serine peptidase [Candidatus Acidoferrales bacterium]|nr:prolyl oligopeptidase family serine peptidase [Candidatus Acidoferrales bacterium]
MSKLMSTPPLSASEPVTEIIHGTAVTDPYRWLEDADSPQTRRWLEEQARYVRAYLDHLPGRDSIRKRIHEFLAVQTYDSFRIAGNRYFFRKRLPNQEQPSIYMREGLRGEDQLLLDPAERGTGKYTAVKPIRVSADGRLLLYEVKAGGERMGTFELLDVENRRTLPDVFARGYLRGFAFAPDSKSFYYVHESLVAARPLARAAYRHFLGASFAEDQEVFYAGEGEKLRLCLISDDTRLGFLVFSFLDKTRTDFYLKPFENDGSPQTVLTGADYVFSPRLIPGRVLAITDREAPNFRILELRPRGDQEFQWVDLVPEEDSRICQWMVAGDRIVVSYVRQCQTRVSVFDLEGRKTDEWPVRRGGRTLRFLAASSTRDELLIESESFTHPAATLSCSVDANQFTRWAEKTIPFDSESYGHRQVWYTSKDGTQIPMFLLGRQDVLKGGCHPAIMTSYGGYGVSMTPQFSVFVAFLVERGCLFALPNIRGGSEFGADWHTAAKRRNRQTTYDDFLAAAQWLVTDGKTTPCKLAIFGGSNSGLLVGAALTQRPDLFRAVVCMVPLLDMLRYHLFDNAHLWRDEFGTAEDPQDFAALLRYSPYHQVRAGTGYPATLLISGDADQNCNALHARKMTARLQAANSSRNPILLDYSHFRGHSPVLPLSDRIEALTDRMAFLCDQLQVPV